jgi:Protein of unknown function (DUF2959)
VLVFRLPEQLRGVHFCWGTARHRLIPRLSKDLFKEWQDELGKYSDRQMRQESERQLRETRARTETLIASMARAQKRVDQS